MYSNPVASVQTTIEPDNQNVTYDWRPLVFLQRMLKLERKSDRKPKLAVVNNFYGEQVDFRELPSIDLKNNNLHLRYDINHYVSKLDEFKKKFMSKTKWSNYVTKKETKMMYKQRQNHLKK